MSKKDQNSGPDPEPADPLSATAMFLKAFDADTAKKPPEPVTPATPRPQNAAPNRPAYTPQPAAPAAGPAAAPGEFTQMFNSLNQRPAATPSAREPQPEVPTHVVKGPAQPQPDQAPGEFTRIFVPGVTPSHTPSARPSEETPRPGPLSSGPSRAKGFSTPGGSDSASAEGSFTQFFNNPGRPAAPVQSSGPPSPERPIARPPVEDNSWKNDPFFRPAEKSSAPDTPSQSVTSILSSLSSSGPGASAPRQPEPAPYRPEPLPSYAPPKPSEEPGGVTRLIQRLAQEPPAPVAPPPAASPAPPPASSGPGEFTRMIAGLGSRPTAPAAAPPAAAAPPPPPLAAPAAPAFAMPAAPAPPAMPRVAPPPMPAPPVAAPPPPPVFAAPAMPAVPKPAPPPAPALAAPKSKLEAMVPILLVINTFLLVLLLVVVIFLIKAK